MAKKRWKTSIKCFASHMDPQKEEELKWIQIEIENNVKRMIKLIKSNINHSTRDSNQQRRSELIQLVEDLHKQYQSLYDLYDNLRGEVRKKCRTKDKENASSSSSSSASSLDSESYFSPEESGRSGDFLRRKSSSCSLNPQTLEAEPEDVILKNTLTSTSEVKESISADSDSPLGSSSSYERVPGSEELFIKDFGVQSEDTESFTHKLMRECSSLKDKLVEKEEQLLSLTKKYELHEGGRMAKMVDLEDQVSRLNLELENSRAQARELEGKMNIFEESKRLESERTLAQMAQVKDLEDQIASLNFKNREHEEKIEFKSNEVIQLQETKLLGDNAILARMKDLDDQVEMLKLEKAALEEKFLYRSNELKQWEESNSSLLAKVTELEKRYKSKQDEFSTLITTYEENEKHSISIIENLQQQVDSLHIENTKLNEELLNVTEEKSQKINSLQQELASLTNQKSELEHLLKTKTHELSECQLEIEGGQKLKLTSMSSEKRMQNHGNNLQNELRNMETEKSILQLRLDKERQESSQDLTDMEKKIMDLETKMTHQQNTILEQEEIINKLNSQQREMQAKFEEANMNFQNAERKIDEMLDELRKKYEDSLKILSRRIRVAEQLHTENKEWYLKTREAHEQESIELKELTERHKIGMQKIKEMSMVANDALASLDTLTLRFNKCASNFINRISSMSCELNFAKDWVSRKHKAIAHVKGDLDCLLSQLDQKEAEILLYRERVWKLETKVRELEKSIEQSEDAMCDLKEQKREAIRQLCVWIDYHRSSCDYYKKMLAEVGLIKTTSIAT